MGREKNAENIPFLRSTQPKSTERVPVVELSGYTGIGYQQYKKDFDTVPGRKTRITQVAAGMTHRF